MNNIRKSFAESEAGQCAPKWQTIKKQAKAIKDKARCTDCSCGMACCHTQRHPLPPPVNVILMNEKLALNDH